MKSAFLGVKIQVAPFSRAFSPGFSTGLGALTLREGRILRLETGSNIGYGEASPLPGHSRESLAEVDAYFSVRVVKDIFRDWVGLDAAMPSSVRMALDSAMQEASIPEGLAQKSIGVNAMLPIQAAVADFAWLEKKWAEGFQTFKFKITPDSAPNTYEQILFLRKISGGKAKVRLDSNGAFTPDTIVPVAALMAPLAIEFWEDPLPLVDRWSWKYFRKESPFPIAIDMALHSLESVRMALEENLADVFILKPSVLGGLVTAKSAIDLVLQARKRFVVTSLLESEIGIRALGNFLTQNISGNLDHGLSTLGLLQENFCAVGPRWNYSFERNNAELTWLDSLAWKGLP